MMDAPVQAGSRRSLDSVIAFYLIPHIPLFSMKAPPRCHFPCMTNLAVPITATQIHAATGLRAYMPGWRHADDALDAVAARFPDWDMLSILVKVVTVNELYATRLLATARMAEHIHGLLSSHPNERDTDLVREIATLRKHPVDHRAHR